jgi:hypothetical protein
MIDFHKLKSQNSLQLQLQEDGYFAIGYSTEVRN